MNLLIGVYWIRVKMVLGDMKRIYFSMSIENVIS